MERLIKYFVPEKYVLNLDIDKYKKTIGGKVVVNGEAKGSVVKFHAVDFEILNVKVDGDAAKYKYADDVLEVTADKGEHEIEIEYLERKYARRVFVYL